jgi:hypothetical protein
MLLFAQLVHCFACHFGEKAPVVCGKSCIHPQQKNIRQYIFCVYTCSASCKRSNSLNLASNPKEKSTYIRAHAYAQEVCMQSVSLSQRFRESSSSLQIALSKAAKCLLLSCSVLAIPASAQTATTTTLTITNSGSAVTTITSGTVITLTATVKAGSTLVMPGQVEFCDAEAQYCEDTHRLAVAQLTATGTAVYKFRPGGGSHSYKAVFLGTKTYAGSSSSDSSLDVIGPFPSVTGISLSATSASSLTLTARVSGSSSSGSPSPTGTVSFLDTSSSNAVLATAPLSVATSGLGFANEFTLPYGPGAVADFNQDGIPDIVEAGLNYQLATLLGKGDGTFAAPMNSGSVGADPSGIAVADFNGDGLPDVAAVGAYDEQVNVDLGNGDGTFASSLTEPAVCDDSQQMLGCNVIFITVGDFNGDGIPDLVVSGGGVPFIGIQYVEVLLGNGDGTFGGPITVENPDNTPVSVAVGDFNGDGIADLAVVHQTPDSISIYLGKGDGTFASGPSLTPGTTPSTIATGDFNGDGILDLAVANAGSHDVSIFLGNGDGTFTSVSPTLPTGSSTPTLPPGSSTSSITVSDFNRDGISDIAVSDQSGYISIFLGKGDGTFTALDNEVNAGASGWIASADFNGDGLPDLAVGSPVVLPGLDVGGAVLLTQFGDAAIATATNVSIPSGSPLAEASYSGDTNFKQSASGTVTLAAPLPIIETPVPGAFLYPGNNTFTWSAGIGVSQYKLDLGTGGAGSSDLYAGASTTALTAIVPLPTFPFNGATITATLYSYISGTWQSTAVTYGEPLAPALITPTPGLQLSGSSVTFAWSPGGGDVTGYTLTVGTKYPGSYDIYASPTITSTSATVTGIPTSGIPIYVRLRYMMNGTWYTLNYTYTASGTEAPPALITPAPGSHLSSGTVTFTWSPGSGVTDDQLLVSTEWPGGDNIYASPVGTATSATATGLPTDGVNLYVTLRYKLNDVWTDLNYTYTADGTTAPPAMLTPAPGSQLTGSSQTFTWSPGSGVTEYELNIGTYGPDYFNVYGSPRITSTSVTVPDLPTDGKPLYVNLHYEINGVWNVINYTYTAQ